MGISMLMMKIQYIVCALAAAALALMLVRRKSRSVEKRVLLLLVTVLVLSAGCLLVTYYEKCVAPDLIVSIVLIELGIFAYVYDSLRSYRSETKNLRHLGSIYILAGVACILSGRAQFPVLLWIIPVVLFSAGYFFLPQRRGLANICKGAGILVSVAYIAWMLIDVKEGALPQPETVPFRERMLTEVIKPSITNELDALNEKVTLLGEEKQRLSAEIVRVRDENRDLQSKLAIAVEGKQEAEKKRIAADKARMAAEEKVKEAEQGKVALQKELSARDAALKESAQKLAELEKARTTVKESFAGIDEKLQRAAEDLKKAVKERDEFAAELEALKNRPTPTPAAGLSKEAMDELTNRLQRKEKENAELGAEVAGLKETLQKIRELLSTPR